MQQYNADLETLEVALQTPELKLAQGLRGRSDWLIS